MSHSRLMFVTNIPTPYRHHFFEELGDLLEGEGGGLRVLYAGRTEPGRHWNPPIGGDHHSAIVLRGITVRSRGLRAHFSPAVLSEINRYSPQWIVTAGSWHAPNTMAALAVAKSKGIPCVFWSEGHAEAVLHSRGLIQQARRAVYGRFDAFAVPNDRSARFAVANSGKQTPTIHLPNVVDDGYWSAPHPGRTKARAGIGVAEMRTIAVVASLEDRKRVREVIEAYGALPDTSRTQLQLLIAGTGELERTLRSMASPHTNLHMLGHLPQEGIRAVYRASDVFLLASRYDPNPLSMVEAAFSGCILAATRSVGNSEELVIDSSLLIDDRRPDVVAEIVAAMQHIVQMNDDVLARLQTEQWNAVNSDWRSLDVASSFLTALAESWPRNPTGD